MDNKCCVGLLKQTECHKLTYVKKKGLENVSDLSEEELNLIKIRSELDDKEIINICLHHKSLFLSKYEFLQKTCCDPFKIHKKPITNSLRVISIQQSKTCTTKGLQVKPGKKLCTNCSKIIFSTPNDDEEESQDDDVFTLPTETETQMQKEEAIDSLNSSLTDVGCSPFKLHALNENSKIGYAQNKLEKLHQNVKKKIETVLDVQLPPKIPKLHKKAEQKAAEMDLLVENIKSEVTKLSSKEKIQLLTIPASLNWSRTKIKDTFEVSDYSARQAQKLYKEKGLLAEPELRRGKKLSPQVVEFVVNFYQSDEQSRVLPGMKDVVSLGGKKYEKKRLILSNLNEMFANFKREHPDIKIGFSKFCTLRPKWCVLAGASGTHSVCVCTIHQNVLLLINAAQLEETHKDLQNLILCETPSQNCMFRRCEKCPSKESLTAFLQTKFENYLEEDRIEFKQWVATDRTQMITQTSTIDEFIYELTTKIEKLIPHSYIAKSQSSYFKSLKDNCAPNQAIISMDFSENFSFVIQDEVQGYHWTSDSCTVHPVIINTCVDDKKIVSSHCIISDDLNHDVCMVYKIQETLLEFVKEHFPNVTDVHYFSDGCAGQYKNKYNFMNLSLHEKDFTIKAQWSFFATSHGKTECDGIGGTVKRLARKASLQRPLQDQILTTTTFYQFCISTISKINFHFISKDSTDLIRRQLEKRFENLNTLPGTRSFHNYRPLDSSGTLEARRITTDEEPSLTYNLRRGLTLNVKEKDLYPSRYIACKYDNLWYFGIITNVSKEDGDVTVKFLHPAGPSSSFYWPKRDDICDVPIPHILAVVEPPHTSTGRTYQFSKECLVLIEKLMIH